MKTKRLVLMALFTALCYVGTSIHIPIPTPGGPSMVHLGTTMIFIIAVLIGEKAAIPAAIGCALMDLLNPAFVAWTIPTLICKGLTGYATGKVAFANGKEGKDNKQNIIAFIIGGIVSLAGYFIFNSLFFVGWQAALVSLSTSLITTGIGLVIAIPLSMAVKRASARSIAEAFDN